MFFRATVQPGGQKVKGTYTRGALYSEEEDNHQSWQEFPDEENYTKQNKLGILKHLNQISLLINKEKKRLLEVLQMYRCTC